MQKILKKRTPDKGGNKLYVNISQEDEVDPQKDVWLPTGLWSQCHKILLDVYSVEQHRKWFMITDKVNGK